MKIVYILLIGALVMHTVKFFMNRADYAEVYLKDCVESREYCTVLKGKLRTDFFTQNYIITSTKNGMDYIVDEMAISRIKYKDHEMIFDINTLPPIENQNDISSSSKPSVDVK